MKVVVGGTSYKVSRDGFVTTLSGKPVTGVVAVQAMAKVVKRTVQKWGA